MQLRPVLLGACLALAFNVYSQQTNLINFVPVSPSAASLGKFGNVPVSYYTGIPSIEVPLYTIEQGSLKVPVKLAYHAGGVKVTELASWVGLGWGLHAGGAIMRNERGLSDDHSPLGFLNNGKTIDASSLTIADYYKAAKGNLDLESDEYIFNFSGASGKFILDQDANAYPIPYQHLKIYPLDNLGRPYTKIVGAIAGWRIITTDGVQYFFRAMEGTSQPLELTHNRHNTAWNLTSIVSADKADTIAFEYEDAGYSISLPVSQSMKVYTGVTLPCGNGSESNSRMDIMHGFSVKRISRIVFKNGTIEFTPSVDDRCDIPGDEYLEKVIVKDIAGIVVKEFILKYGYMFGTSITPVENFTCPISNDVNAVRLALLSVHETGKTPYLFDYIKDKGLPSRFSTSQDHWGFFNRDHSDFNTLIPEGFETSPPPIRFMGTNREANVDFGKQGSLYKVTYPTGGTTTYEYEAHKAKLSSLKNFPELSYGYTVTTNAARTFQVDYGANNQIIGTFTINYLGSGTGVSFKAENFVESSGAYFKIVNSANEDISVGLGTVDGPTRYYSTGTLPNGTYKIVAMKDGGGNSSGLTYTLILQEYDNVTYSQAQLITIGGLRVRKITDTDPLTNAQHTREFEYTAGILTWGIKYASRVKEYLCYTLNGASLTSYTLGDFYLISSNSNYPLSNTQGAPVGYSTVVERQSTYSSGGTRTDNGYTEYSYATAELYPDQGFISYYMQGHSLTDPPVSGPSGLYSDNTSSSINYQFPFTPPRNNDWKRGQLLSKTIYKRESNGTYRVVSREKNTYGIGTIELTRMNVKCGVIFDASIRMNEVSEIRPINAPMDEVAFSYYDTKGEYLYLTTSEHWTFDNIGRSNVSKTEYFYDNVGHLLPTRTVASNSAGEREVMLTIYPKDYAAGTLFIDKLVENNNISSPIELVTYTDGGSETKIKDGYIFTYSNDGTGLKESVKALENTDNLLLSDFKFSNTAIGVLPIEGVSRTTFTPHSFYVDRVLFSKYKNGKLLDQHKVQDISDSYIWGYNDHYLIAHVRNATSDGIAYTGFEDDAHGNWSINGGSVSSVSALTGDRSYFLASGDMISKTSLPIGNYIVSYWSKSGSLVVNGTTASGSVVRNGWTYFSHKLNIITGVSVSSSGNATIDDLRLYPEVAQMETYTYKLLVGVSSITDVNNYTLFYYYDSNSRLQTVKDAEGNIVQNFKYHYKGQ